MVSLVGSGPDPTYSLDATTAMIMITMMNDSAHPIPAASNRGGYHEDNGCVTGDGPKVPQSKWNRFHCSERFGAIWFGPVLVELGLLVVDFLFSATKGSGMLDEDEYVAISNQ
uniref:Uncharacterized protein n=1 Tax=Anopheles farauti TaxID=69004 RepID=A0A182QZD2_9DIPT